MTITTDNYELYFYQYAEGELDAAGREAVEAFASQHPELAEELALYDPDLKLAESHIPCPNKESLLHHDRQVLPLWRWVAAACLVGLLGGVWLFWPVSQTPQQLAALHPAEVSNPSTQPKGEADTVEKTDPSSLSEPQLAVRTVRKVPMPSVTEERQSVADVAELQMPVEDQPTTQSEISADPMLQSANESAPQLLASAEPVAEEEPTKTLVIEYTDIVLASNVVVEEVNRVEEGKVSIRLRNLRSRVSNTIRDYAYQAYAETRGELLALADR